MNSQPIDYASRLAAIRKAEGLSQRDFSALVDLSLYAIRNYESGKSLARVDIVERVVRVESFKKYTLWLLRDKSNPLAGQIAPALSLSGLVGSEVLRLRPITARGEVAGSIR
ncbi:helix-turn-helix domain-containing protein [Enterobacter asburiae]|uniref:helix-turn-helix domain-containing protein n=1 Tax=Enterobacter asburiae TaxID=61645 RepID=UPI000F87A4CA|nr:helix-turn-helix transcriptional regulator [Enterobacter asburiae]RTP91499.1 XRE family transcriptional regulator [Enterobacter asburiae]